MTFSALFRAIDERRDRVADISDRVDQSSLELARLGSEIDAIPEIVRNFRTADSALSFSRLGNGLEALSGFVQESLDTFATDAGDLRDRMSATKSNLSDDFEVVRQAHGELDGQTTQLLSDLDAIEGLLELLTEKLHLSMTEAQQDQDRIGASIRMIGAESQFVISEFALSVQSGRDELGEALNSMIEMIQEIRHDRWAATSSNLLDTIDDAFFRLDQAVHEQGRSLGDHFESYSRSLEDFVSGDVLQEFDGMFMRLTSDALEAMSATLHECATTMQMGSAIASAISSWTPALSGIKEIVEFVRMLIDG